MIELLSTLVKLMLEIMSALFLWRAIHHSKLGDFEKSKILLLIAIVFAIWSM